MVRKNQLSVLVRALCDPFVRCMAALAEWVAHAVLCAGILGCIWAVGWVTRVTLQGEPLFGIVPLAWVFHAADLAVLLGISYHGVRAAIHAYRGSAPPVGRFP